MVESLTAMAPNSGRSDFESFDALEAASSSHGDGESEAVIRSLRKEAESLCYTNSAASSPNHLSTVAVSQDYN